MFTSLYQPAETYRVQLFCKSAPLIDKARLFAELRKYCADIEPLDSQENDGSLAFVHTRHMVQYRESRIPAQAFIHFRDEMPDLAELMPAVQQSWRLADASKVISSCKHSVSVSDFMASGLDYRTRFDLFLRVLRAVLTIVPCVAIHWIHAEQIVACEDYVNSQGGPLVDQMCSGPINVRFFNIEHSAADRLMDTLGLFPFGLPDLQCHFRGLEPRDVARVIYGTAFYLYESGDVIKDGHTVDGVGPASKWICHHEQSLAKPDRIVLDLNPGSHFAAGKRKY
jgi:hypothetical protein